jgi:hypothetical protein
MKKLIIAAIAIAGFAAPSLATERSATPKTTHSQGSAVGQASSSFTGNGAAIGGGTNGSGQTTSPGSRAQEVQGFQAQEGRGRINSTSSTTKAK